MNIAIIENDVVVNVIVIDSLIAAQEIFKNAEILEVNETNNIGINWDRKSGKWRSPKPEYDCVWDETYNTWFTEEEIDNIYNSEPSVFTPVG